MIGFGDAVSRRMIRRLGFVCTVMTLAACASGGPGGPVTTSGKTNGRTQVASLDRISPDFHRLSGWGADDHAFALPALLRSCDWMDKQSPDRPLGDNPLGGRVADWKPVCSAARTLRTDDHEAARTFFEAHFTPVSLYEGQEGLFTGYYEPILRGSWTRTERYSTPLYKMPPRGSKRLPSRAAIVDGALAGRGLEILWVDDPIGAFFLQIQGSGRVLMPDGTMVGVGYAGQNGHDYFPIGRYLIDQGYATREEMSLQFIRRWLEANPGQANRVMNLNPSYVFFKVRGDDVARGARNMGLTPGRSLAVDPDHVPLGAALWVELSDAPVSSGRIHRLVMAQDTGGAIKGQVRGDLFWGHGDEAEQGAGMMKARGRYHILVPRTISATVASRSR